MRTTLILALIVGLACTGWAATSIHDTNKYAYAANAGWVNGQADTNNGAVVTEFYCYGYLYGANIGWVNLGDGTPTNGWMYSNGSADDFGVNHDRTGVLTGYAYGANVGWINFNTGSASIDLLTGKFRGYAYGANIGWISLSNAQAHVQTDSISPGPDTDLDGIPDPWEYWNGGNLSDLGTNLVWSDFDGDGVSDKDEEIADTDPFSGGESYLHIATEERTGPTETTLTWPSRPSRNYRIGKSGNPEDGSGWTDSGLGEFRGHETGFTTTGTVTEAVQPNRIFRVQAIRPLAP